MCLWEYCPSVFPALSGEGICLPLTPTLYSEKPGDMRLDSLHALKMKGQNVRPNMSNYLFVIPVQYEKGIPVHLQFVLEFIFYHAQCYCSTCYTVSMQFCSCSPRKIFVNEHELLIGQFLLLFLVYFGLFCLVRPCKFLCIKCFKKGKKPVTLTPSPPPSTIRAGVLDVKWEAKLKNLGA